LIGRTPLTLFNPAAESPFLFAAGDYLQFTAIALEEYSAIQEQVASGSYAPQIRSVAIGSAGNVHGN